MRREERVKVVLVRELLVAHEEHVLQVMAQPLGWDQGRSVKGMGQGTSRAGAPARWLPRSCASWGAMTLHQPERIPTSTGVSRHPHPHSAPHTLPPSCTVLGSLQRPTPGAPRDRRNCRCPHSGLLPPFSLQQQVPLPRHPPPPQHQIPTLP